MDRNIEKLHDSFKNKDWFFSVGKDEFNRVVVYVKYMCQSTLYDIPTSINGQQVLVHFAGSHTATLDRFVTDENKSMFRLKSLAAEAEDPDKNDLEDELELDFDIPSFSFHDVKDLINELERLEDICGAAVEDIFYEIHDGKNAVTNFSAKFPEVRRSMESLYEDYGFDIISEQFEA